MAGCGGDERREPSGPAGPTAGDQPDGAGAGRARPVRAQDGFEETTVERIAEAAGVGRRTFFRYYASKNDVVWGEFDVMLQQMEAYLDKVDDGPVIDGLAEAVIRFNAVPPAAVAAHRQRMALILHVPALQAHSTLRYAEWRDVVARYVARRTGTSADSFDAQLVGQLRASAPPRRRTRSGCETSARTSRTCWRRPSAPWPPASTADARSLRLRDGAGPGSDYPGRTISGAAKSSLAITTSAAVIGSHSTR